LLALAYVLVLAVVSLGIPLALSLRDRVSAEVHSQALSQADVVAATAADLLSPPNTVELDAIARSSGDSVRGRVLIVDARGRVLADSASRATRGSSYVTRPEIASALRGRSVQTQRSSHSLGESILATAVPVLRRGSAIGAVRVTQSVAAVQHAVNTTTAKLALVAATVLLLGLIAGVLIARQVALPLKRLEIAARRIAGGDLFARATVEGSSEQRSLSASFNEMADRNQRLIGAQREFVADASHQLRTPLTALRLRLEEARATGVGEDAAMEIDAGTAEVDRLAAIVDELLVLSRAEDRELDGDHVDLSDAANRAARRWDAAAHARRITLSCNSDRNSTAWCATADLDRALDVLIENALAYSPAGSEVALVGENGRIEVRDRGPGLAPGEEQLVFERFHRGSAGRQGPAGSGLGLAIARTLVRAWHGDVRLSNRPGGGAVAALEFPKEGDR
jgi:two-component system, OmpR family, sensor kinase